MSSYNYMCCGVPSNPFDDIFGGATQPVEENNQKASAWDNPFGVLPPGQQQEQGQPSQAAVDSRSVTSWSQDGYSYASDARSMGASTMTGSYASSNLENKSLKDIEREERARSRATLLSETYSDTGDLKKNTSVPRALGLGGGVMTSDQASYILQKKGIVKNSDGTLMNKRTMKSKRRLFHLIRRTESSRPKKEKTPEDVRDPETVPGMKLNIDIEKEEKAREKATQMISNGAYPHHPKASLAFYINPHENEKPKVDKGPSPIV